MPPPRMREQGGESVSDRIVEDAMIGTVDVAAFSRSTNREPPAKMTSGLAATTRRARHSYFSERPSPDVPLSARGHFEIIGLLLKFEPI